MYLIPGKALFVIVDRFKIGPELLSPFSSFQQILLNFAANASLDIPSIYLSNDGKRLTSNKSQSWWRNAVDNWQGILPLLTRILPPSFNPNTLHDPLAQLATPFIFPFTVKAFAKMPIDCIRSYSFSTGVSLPIDILAKEKTTHLLRENFISKAIASLPFSVFKKGKSRINVLRKSKMTAWAGLTHTNKLGHAINLSLGRALAIFAKVTPVWSGIPAPLFPIEGGIEGAAVNKEDLLFEFDLQNMHAISAYEQAIQGNFSPAYDKDHVRRFKRLIQALSIILSNH